MVLVYKVIHSQGQIALSRRVLQQEHEKELPRVSFMLQMSSSFQPLSLKPVGHNLYFL